jgi:uncharacterized membrane protein YhiD involved in acid resistance
VSLAAAAAPIAVKSATGVLTAAGVWSGVLALGLLVVLAYIKVMPRLRELENTNNAGIRKEFIAEMAELREEVRGLRTEVRERDNKIDQLRNEIRELHGVIDGMRRENLAAQLTGQSVVARTMPQSPVMERALRSIDEITGNEP